MAEPGFSPTQDHYILRLSRPYDRKLALNKRTLPKILSRDLVYLTLGKSGLEI